MKPIALSVALFCLAFSSAHAEPRVSYALHTYAPGTSDAITSVKAWQEFDLALVVRDLRPGGGTYISKHPKYLGQRLPFSRGVFAAYVNVNFASRYAKVLQIDYTGPYKTVWASCDISDNGVREWGSAAGGTGQGSSNTEPTEVSRIRLVAKWPPVAPGTQHVDASFRQNFVRLSSPRFDTQLYGTLKERGGRVYYPGEHSTVTADEIQATGTTLRILK